MSVEFWAALLGALVGGLATLGGSVIVNRREVRRAARLRLHDELLPALEDALLIDRLEQAEIAVAAVRRAAVVAGRAAVELAKAVDHEFTRFSFAATTVNWGTFDPVSGTYVGASGTDKYRETQQDVRGRVRAMQDWVAEKIL